jgi:hypothetical protein
MKNEQPTFDSAEAVMTYVAARLDAIEQDTNLLVKQRAERRYPIAAMIRTEVSRVRWALTFVQGAPPEPKP